MNVIKLNAYCFLHLQSFFFFHFINKLFVKQCFKYLLRTKQSFQYMFAVINCKDLYIECKVIN